LLNGQDRGRAHAATGGLTQAGIDDGPIRFCQGILNGATGIFLGGEPILENARNDLCRQAARLLATILAAHPVGDQKDLTLGIGDEAILVVWSEPLCAAATELEN
jgi:hypothetical protein